MNANNDFLGGLYNAMMSLTSSENTLCFRTITLVKVNGSLKFYKNVQYHKSKVGIEFGGYGTNSLGIRGQKQVFL